jgi:hypothetical protein
MISEIDPAPGTHSSGATVVRRALRRRGQDHRNLLQAELPGAPAEARECRILPDGAGAAPRAIAPASAAVPTRSAAIREAVAKAIELIEGRTQG